MKTLSPALIALFATRQFFAWDLFMITLADGSTVYRYCAGQMPVLTGGNTFASGHPGGPFFSRKDSKAKVHWKVGVEVDTLAFDIMPGSSTISGVTWQAAALTGIFDGATIQLDRAFFPLPAAYATPLVPTGTVPCFLGRVSTVEPSRSGLRMNVASHLELLNINLPRNLFQAGCLNTLFDGRCTLVAADWSESGTAAAGSTISSINVNLTGADSIYNLGSITFTSGALTGMSRTIKTYVYGSPGVITLAAPFPSAPAAADGLTVTRGCNKKYDDAYGCSAFSNTANFRATPFVPVAETAV